MDANIFLKEISQDLVLWSQIVFNKFLLSYIIQDFIGYATLS
jgi:hypothetical protein